MAIHSGCHLIAVIGGKGGVGKSVFAGNLAFALSLETRSPALLIDCDSKSCGDQNIITGLRPNKTLSELCSFTGTITPQTLPTLVASHPSGLAYIGAVRGPDETLLADPEIAMKQIGALSRAYKHIVCDLGSDLGPLQMSIIEQATVLLIVTAPEVLVNNQTHRLVGELLSKSIPSDMLQLVINKASAGGLSPAAISQSLRMQPLALIPQDDVTTANALKTNTAFVIGAPKTPISTSHHDVVRKLTGGLLQKLKSLTKPKITRAGPSTSDLPEEEAGQQEKLDPRTLLKLKAHHELIKAMDLKKGITDTQGNPQKEQALRAKTQQVITSIVDRENSGMARDERSRIIKEILDEALGLGPLEDLIADSNVSEIMVNGAKKIFIEKGGSINKSTTTFTSNLHLRNVIERIVTPLGRRIDEKTPYVDARLHDGSRVNAIIEPLAIDGPSLTIRKFKKGGITAEKYMEFGSINKAMIDFLKVCVENRLNIVISGGTGSGKTSLLNMLSTFIRSDLRIITVEDAAELQLQQDHVVRLETRPANMEGTGAVTIRDLIKNTLRMRPDVIVVGETRDGAALDMLQAMNTGHDGSMTTTHANSPRECISRLETLCLMAGMDLPAKAIREQISKAVNLIVQIQRLSDGSRKITSITEVCGMQGDTVTLAEIFRFKEKGFDKNRRIVGEFQAMGFIPTFIESLEQKGVKIPRHIFTNEKAPEKPTGDGGAKKPGLGLAPMKMPPKKVGGTK